MDLVYNIYFEISAAAFMLIFNIYLFLQYSSESTINKEFKKLTMIDLLAIILDIITAITISYASVIPNNLNMVVNTVYYAVNAFLGYQFMIYSTTYIYKERKETKSLVAAKIILLVYYCFLAANLFIGWAFYFDDGKYIHGKLYLLMYGVAFYYIIHASIIIMSGMKSYAAKKRVSIVMYTVLGLIGSVAQILFFPDVLLGLFTVSLGIVMMLFSMETPDYQKLIEAVKELEYTRAQAEEANRAKTEFLAGMSNDVKTPINAILGYNEMILNETHENNTADYAYKVRLAGKTLLTVVDDILDFAEIDSGKFKIENKPYSVKECLREVISYARYNTDQKMLELSYSIDELIPSQLNGDMVKLMRIINNLVFNSVKYTKEGFVNIEIKWIPADRSKGRLHICVTDSGVGFKPEDIEKVKNNFADSSQKKAKNIHGLGLDLTIVAMMVKLMGSNLEIKNEAGKGCSVSFAVKQGIISNNPIGRVTFEENRLVSENDSYGEIESYEKAHILVVDDNAINRQLARQMLGDEFNVSCAESGRKTFEFLENHIPDLILLDIHMPEMDGFEVLKKIKSSIKYKSIPVIFLTIDDNKEVEVKSLREGAHDFITKPFVADIMIQRIKRILKIENLQKKLNSEVHKQTCKAEERQMQLGRLSLQTMKTLAGAIDAKDKYTNGHSMRVAEYSKEIARRAGKSEKEQEDIYYIGLLHDIGKIGIPDDIINKTSRLTDEEYDIIKSHPAIGADILKNISEIPDISTGAHWHHERYDGRGYPDKLKGTEIPEVARIIGVADAYDAMTSNRSYRKVLSQEYVRGEIENGMGAQFDPYFAELMLQMIDEDVDYKMREYR